jgi:AcrR family transcriptional regulator
MVRDRRNDSSKNPPIAPLPQGAHGLPRELVRRNQRERLIAGAAEAAAERGFMRVRLSDIVRHAGVSLGTFYKHFANKEECIEAAFGASLASLQEKEGEQRFGSPVMRAKAQASDSSDTREDLPPESIKPPQRAQGLPRELVQRNQRQRLIAGAAEAVAERGFARVTVADIIRYAGVSRLTFYEHFANREDCLQAARGISLVQKSEDGS